MDWINAERRRARCCLSIPPDAFDTAYLGTGRNFRSDSKFFGQAIADRFRSHSRNPLPRGQPPVLQNSVGAVSDREGIRHQIADRLRSYGSLRIFQNSVGAVSDRERISHQIADGFPLLRHAQAGPTSAWPMTWTSWPDLRRSLPRVTTRSPGLIGPRTSIMFSEPMPTPTRIWRAVFCSSTM